MKIFYLFIILISTQTSFGQNLDFEKFEFKGLNFYSSKSKIIKKFGDPNKQFEPNYDCGGLSAEWQGVKYFTLEYRDVKFTGNEKEKYLIEKINFKNDNTIELIYGKHKLNCETELNMLSEIFGKQIKDRIAKGQLNGLFTVQHEKMDDGITLEIENGKLISFGYWTSC
ncbi:hypothetical protein M0D21_02435 [Aquimarina sp. D1M17]|uniref:hypothetical protein n=1 Tax=Aquimarina acroporae TaxID=2937283 RepID=UPI0020BF9356|nr:hypothetical protein [Aquimarina acroporae]MCK8520405.1 hypothetical protein [Aquimarina acroporae]